MSSSNQFHGSFTNSVTSVANMLTTSSNAKMYPKAMSATSSILYSNVPSSACSCVSQMLRKKLSTISAATSSCTLSPRYSHRTYRRHAANVEIFWYDVSRAMLYLNTRTMLATHTSISPTDDAIKINWRPLWYPSFVQHTANCMGFSVAYRSCAAWRSAANSSCALNICSNSSSFIPWKTTPAMSLNHTRSSSDPPSVCEYEMNSEVSLMWRRWKVLLA